MQEASLRYTQPVAPGQSPGWHNHVPAWVLSHPAYKSYRHGIRHTLQEIANACDPPDAFGDLIGAFGGVSLTSAIGCSRGTFFRHVQQLASDGFLVVVARGGLLGGRNAGNVYGIPGTPGSLDARRCRRRVQIMVRNERGKLAPQVLHPGDQATFWRQPPPTQPPDRGKGAPQNETGGSLKMRRGVVSKRDATRINPGITGTRQSGAQRYALRRSGASSKPSRSKPRLSNVKAEDLENTGRLLEIYDQAVQKGWAAPSEHGKFQFVAKAVYALRKHTDKRGPGPLFVSILKSPLFDTVTQADEDNAISRLSDHHYGEDRKRRQRDPLEEALS